MVTMPSRELRRDRVQALLTANGSWQQVYNYQPKSFDQQSPVATVHNGPVRTIDEAFGGQAMLQLGVVVTNFVKRDDAADAEDTLDTLLQTVVQVIADNQDDSLWEYVEVDDTAPDYVPVDGVPYRIEIIPLWLTVFMT